MVFASATSSYTSILIILAGSGGLVGAFVALVKLRGDTSSQAVAQAQGANEVMEEALKAMQEQRDYWRARQERSHAERNELAARVQELEQQIRDLRAASSG